MSDVKDVDDIVRMIDEYMARRDKVAGDFRRNQFMARPTVPTRELLEVMNLSVQRFLALFPPRMTPLQWEAFSELIHMTTAQLNADGTAIPGRNIGG